MNPILLNDKNVMHGATDAGENLAFARSALRRMALIRAFEQRCWEMSVEKPSPICGSVHLCAGQEAIPVGAVAALAAEDRVMATYRGHGWALELCPDPLAVMAEMLHRADGINGGRAGSAFMMAPQHRLLWENSIVAGGVPMACGAAMAMQMRQTGGVVVATFGDGAMSQGALHEAFVMASYKRLPVIFICEHNEWSEMTPTSKIARIPTMTLRVAGYDMAAATVDGCDPLAVRDAVLQAKARALAGDGPTFLECRTVRLWGHYNNDIEHYRPKADRIQAAARDPIPMLSKRLTELGAMTGGDIEEVLDGAAAEVAALAERAMASPFPDPATAALHVCASPPAATAAPAPSSDIVEMRYIEAVNAALRAELQARPEVLVYGEDVGQPGGIFGASRNLQRDFGEERVFDTPIAESAILGTAVGAAVMGMRPIVEIMYADFVFVAFDQLINQAANVRYASAGTCQAPMVVRMQQGATPGSCAQHAQSIEALLAHVPGLRVGLPSTPQDAYAMLRAAVADPDPCVIIESRTFYQQRGPVRLDATIEPIGGARLRRDGKDAAIITWGAAVPVVLEAAEALAQEDVEIAVLDLRWLAPLDDAAIDTLVRQCGSVLIVHEANLTGGFGAEISARIVERNAGVLEHPPYRLGAPDIRMPASPVLQRALLPSAASIREAILKLRQ